MYLTGEIQQPNVIYLMDHEWQREHRRPHLKAIAKYCRLLCVEPPITIDIPFRKAHTFFNWIFRRQWKIRLTEAGIYLIKPVALVPHVITLQFPLFARINRILLERQLRQVLAHLGMKDVVLIIAHMAEIYLMGLLGERVLCYAVYEEFSAHSSLSEMARRRLQRAEMKILRTADIVFASSHNLWLKKKAINPNTHFTPNSADVSFFMRSLDKRTVVPPDLAVIPEPRIGLIGNINEIVDLGLINFLAENRPDWSIVLIGEVNGGKAFKRSTLFRKSQQLPNVYYLGFKDYNTLPAYQKGLQVCLLPYLINNYTRYVHPNKTYQYMAGGKPIVATGLAEVMPLCDIVRIAGDREKYMQEITEALQDNGIDSVARRLKVALNNNIQTIEKKRIKLIIECLSKKREAGQNHEGYIYLS
ncbi:MAG: glycosyltransferase [Thermodesulfobacteriota bacterium]